MRSLGNQIVAEFHNCDRRRLNDAGFVEELTLAAAMAAGATIVSPIFHHLSPHGVSGAVIIAESHSTIHNMAGIRLRRGRPVYLWRHGACGEGVFCAARRVPYAIGVDHGNSSWPRRDDGFRR